MRNPSVDGILSLGHLGGLAMTIYLIARMEITDPERYEDYVAKAPALFAKHGGHVVAFADAPRDP